MKPKLIMICVYELKAKQKEKKETDKSLSIIWSINRIGTLHHANKGKTVTQSYYVLLSIRLGIN